MGLSSVKAAFRSLTCSETDTARKAIQICHLVNVCPPHIQPQYTIKQKTFFYFKMSREKFASEGASYPRVCLKMKFQLT